MDPIKNLVDTFSKTSIQPNTELTLDSLSINTDPVIELNQLLKECKNNVEKSNLRNAHAYRIWLWINYKKTVEQEISSAIEKVELSHF